jgi:hypothetical protein
VLHRPLRPLALVSLVAFGDYLLWNWSLSANHDILALVSGLTLPPLLIAFAWLFVLSAVRLIAGSAQRPRARANPYTVDVRARQRAAGSAANRGASVAGAARAPLGGGAATVAGEASPASPSSKLAA